LVSTLEIERVKNERIFNKAQNQSLVKNFSKDVCVIGDDLLSQTDILKIVKNCWNPRAIVMNS